MMKRKHVFTIGTSSLDAYDKLPELHKTTLSEFRNKEVLLKSIDTQFVKIINQEMSNIDIMDRLLLLINSIYKCTENHFEGSKIFLFGSRMSGLALKDSDVDLYFCIAGTFGGALSNDRDLQKELVGYFGKILSCHNNEYKYIRQITRALVPIVKFLHVPTGLYCDISFKNWDCTVCTLEKAKQIWEVPTISCWDLLFGFFKFYSDSGDLKQYVFCPAIGKAIRKDKFHQIPILHPDILDFNKKKNENPLDWSKVLKYKFCGENLALQVPFELFNYLTRCIVPRKLRIFSHLCNKTMQVMKNQVQKNYNLYYNQNN